MSGDRGPSVLRARGAGRGTRISRRTFTLIGRQADLEREIGRPAAANVSCLFAAEVVEMTDHPREALRRKKDSSMRRAIDW
jgi:fatty acid/phospholipid biosynthesis enzyme